MRFRRNAPLDTGQVTDLRGSRMGGGLAVEVGLGLVAIVIWLHLALSGGGSGLGGSRSTARPSAKVAARRRRRPVRISTCRTGEDANEREDCRIVGVVNSVQKFWAGVFRTATSSTSTRTPSSSPARRTPAAGRDLAGRAVLLPADKHVYIDLGFFDDLQVEFGVNGRTVRRGVRHRARVRPSRAGPARCARQDRRRQQGPESGSVRAELQADCYAGVWAAHAVDTGLIEQLTQADINSGLDAAAAIGDDRIQEGRRDR